MHPFVGTAIFQAGLIAAHDHVPQGHRPRSTADWNPVPEQPRQRRSREFEHALVQADSPATQQRERKQEQPDDGVRQCPDESKQTHEPEGPRGAYRALPSGARKLADRRVAETICECPVGRRERQTLQFFGGGPAHLLVFQRRRRALDLHLYEVYEERRTWIPV